MNVKVTTVDETDMVGGHWRDLGPSAEGKRFMHARSGRQLDIEIVGRFLFPCRQRLRIVREHNQTMPIAGNCFDQTERSIAMPFR